MRRIDRIPVLGYLVRLAGSIFRLPKQNDIFAGDLARLQGQLNEQATLLQKQVTGQLELLQEQIDGQLEVLREQTEQTENIGRKIGALQTRVETGQLFYEGFEAILNDGNCIERLNRQTSNFPTIWGEKERLHISPLAAVFTCFFNTNSGEITVGDYTFAGSHVSILAGSHDMLLEGLSRRDAELKQGCDIVIGKGVWLASGCTILGPCTIGDNAVIAAGAVVTSGTVVLANTVYGGVPAKMLRKIEPGVETGNPHVLDAVEREQGTLFVDGWSEKCAVISEKAEMCGHWLIRSGAYLYTNRQKLHLFCHKDGEAEAELIFRQGEQKSRVVVDRNDMEIWVSTERNAGSLSELSVSYDDKAEVRLFIAVMQPDQAVQRTGGESFMEATNTINIEEIMEQIRANIKERGYEKEPLDFEEIEVPSIAAPISGAGNGGFQEEEWNRELQYLNTNWSNDYNAPIYGGNAIGVFIRKVIRKCTRFIIFPVVNFQNLYNASNVRCMNQIEAYMKELEQYKKRVEKLEQELEQLKGSL